MRYETGTYRFKKQPNQYTSKFQRLIAKLRWLVRRIMQITIVSATGIGVVYGAFIIGQYSSPITVTANTKTIIEKMNYPILDRIAKCESNKQHIDPRTGQVRTEPNKNGTVDIGYYQINEYYWGSKATEMSLDLTKEEDNKKMGEWIYANYGTEPWGASKKCWYK